VAAASSVRRRDDVAGACTPSVDHTIDRLRSEVRPVGEANGGSLEVRPERGEAAPKRRAWAALPVDALDDADGVARKRVCAGDGDDLVDTARADALGDPREKQLLLRRAETGRRARREDDGGYPSRRCHELMR
jgi:hypothetical protein